MISIPHQCLHRTYAQTPIYHSIIRKGLFLKCQAVAHNHNLVLAMVAILQVPLNVIFNQQECGMSIQGKVVDMLMWFCDC